RRPRRSTLFPYTTLFRSERRRRVVLLAPREAALALGAELPERRHRLDRGPPLIPVLGARGRPPLLEAASLEGPRRLLERRQVEWEGQVVAVEDDAAGPDELCERRAERPHVVWLEPVERGRREHSVDLAYAEALRPRAVAQIGLDPGEPPAEVAEHRPAHRKQHGIEVDGDTPCLGQASQQTLAQRAWARGQVERDERLGQQRLHDVEHRVEAALAVGEIDGLLRSEERRVGREW